MKRIIMAYLCIAIVLLACGCGDKEKPQTAQMKDASELKETWDELETEIWENLDFWRQAEAILDRYAKDYFAELKKNALRRLYGILSDPQAEVSAARESLRLFVKMNATEVIRESLLHKNRDVVIIASEALIQEAEKAGKDKGAIPYLIYVLAQNNYIQQGSEEASIHQNMKRKLIEAIQQITNLDIKISEIDEDDPQEVERVLSLARTWTKQKGIKLFEE